MEEFVKTSMDPELLDQDELEYELALRNLSSVSTVRLRTATLLRVMLEEERGETEFPSNNLRHVIPDSEYNICMGKIGELGRFVDQGISTRDEGLIMRCYTRAVHLSQRTNRLPINDAFIGDRVLALRNKSIDLLDRVSYAKSNKCRERRVDDVGVSSAHKAIDNDLERLDLLEREISRLQTSLHEMNLQTRESQVKNNEVQATVVSGVQLNATNPFILDVEQPVDYQHSSPYRASTIPYQPYVNANRQGDFGTDHYSTNKGQSNAYPSQPRTDHYNMGSVNRQVHGGVPNQNNAYQNYGNDRLDDVAQVRIPYQPYQNRHQVEDRGQNNSHRDSRRSSFYRERKQIPVQQWKLSYNGESNLNDFLSQVEMFRQMEDTSEEELLTTIGYLFTGRASKWLRVNYNRYRTWEGFKRALRDEFLPIHSDFNIIHDLDKRYQQKNESFSEYLSSMQLLFSFMSDPPSAQHQLYYIRKNMSPAYAMAIASQSFETVEQLSVICKRMDDTRNMMQRRNETVPVVSNDRGRYVNRNNPFFNEMEYDETEEEIQAFENNNRVVKCWDCLENGHSFRACTNPQGRKFCFICGRREFTSRNCPQCSRVGNGRSNLAVPGVGQAL